MNSPQKPSSWLASTVILLVLLAALAPVLITLAGALLPLVLVVTFAVVLIRLVFFHTRRF